MVEFDKPADGTDVELTATVTDKAGNKSPEGSDTSTVDLVVPGDVDGDGEKDLTGAPVVVIQDGGDDVINPSDLNDDGTVDAIVTFPKDAGYSVGDTVVIKDQDDNTLYEGELSQGDLDNGITVKVTPAAEGEETVVTAVVTDPQGNTSPEGKDNSSVDLVVPGDVEEDEAVAAVVEVELDDTVNLDQIGMENVEVGENGGLVSNDPGTVIRDIVAEYQEFLNTGGENLLNTQQNVGGESGKTDIFFVDFAALDALNQTLANQSIYLKEIKGHRGATEKADWIYIADSSEGYNISSNANVNNPGAVNSFDNVTIKRDAIDGLPERTVNANQIQGIMFADGTVYTYDSTGKVGMFKTYNVDLSAKLKRGEESSLNLTGISFSSEELEAKTVTIVHNDPWGTWTETVTYTPIVKYNGEVLTPDSEGKYQIDIDPTKADQTFTLQIMVPTGIITAADESYDSYADVLSDSLEGNVEPNTVPAMAGRSLRTAEANDENDFAIDEDSIFKVLNQEYALADGEANQVDGFTLGSEDQIDVSSLLSADATESNLAEFISVDYDAENKQAVISIDRDGAAEQYQSEHLVVLLNQQEAFKLEDLVQHNQIIIG